MKAVLSRLSYANVVATIALFLALGGGAVYAASKVRSGDIAANAVKKKQLAKNSVTNRDFRKKSLITKNANGGGQTINVAATPPATGFPLPLSGQTSFKPKKGYIGLLMAEVKATLATIAPPSSCTASVTFFVNGIVVGGVFLSDNPFGPADPTGAPFTVVASFAAPIGLTGGNQKITAEYDG
ncbi:MAG: hypothetical protein ACRDKV_07805, partial [Solirubrobacterales bacterium]